MGTADSEGKFWTSQRWKEGAEERVAICKEWNWKERNETPKWKCMYYLLVYNVVKKCGVYTS